MTKSTKTDNANLASKLKLRRHMLHRHHADGDIRVFDCCQGEGIIWSKLRSEFALTSYWGVDVKPKRGRLKIDSTRVVCQPGLRCNVIDIDTYGLPWNHWVALLPTIVEPTTVFLTMALASQRAKQKTGGSTLPKAVKSVLGIPDSWEVSKVFTEHLCEMATSHYLAMPAANGYRVVEAWESTRGSRARYFAVRLDKPRADAPSTVVGESAANHAARRKGGKKCRT
jgi:hypothetical protein